MAVVAARFRVRLADEPDPTGAVRPHPARPRNLAAIFAPADRMRRSGVHGVRGRARGRRPRHCRAALHGRAAAFGSRRVRVAGRHRRARGARPARHRPPQQDKPGGRDQRRAVREGRRRPEGGLTEDAVIGTPAPSGSTRRSAASSRAVRRRSRAAAGHRPRRRGRRPDARRCPHSASSGGAWGGVYYSPVCGAGSRAFEAVEPGLEAEWVRAPAGSPPAGVALGPSLRGRRISSK